MFLEKSLKVYYLHLKFVNSGRKVAVVTWVDPEGKQRNLDIIPGLVEDKAIFTATEAPASVEITAKDKETNIQITVNKVEKLEVLPKEVDEVVTVNIGQGIQFLSLILPYDIIEMNIIHVHKCKISIIYYITVSNFNGYGSYLNILPLLVLY